jgi:hypothetical protein
VSWSLASASIVTASGAATAPTSQINERVRLDSISVRARSQSAGMSARSIGPASASWIVIG